MMIHDTCGTPGGSPTGSGARLTQPVIANTTVAHASSRRIGPLSRSEHKACRAAERRDVPSWFRLLSSLAMCGRLITCPSWLALPAPRVVRRRRQRCQTTAASSSGSVRRVTACCGHSPATAACSVRTAIGDARLRAEASAARRSPVPLRTTIGSASGPSARGFQPARRLSSGYHLCVASAFRRMSRNPAEAGFHAPIRKML